MKDPNQFEEAISQKQLSTYKLAYSFKLLIEGIIKRKEQETIDSKIMIQLEHQFYRLTNQFSELIQLNYQSKNMKLNGKERLEEDLKVDEVEIIIETIKLLLNKYSFTNPFYEIELRKLLIILLRTRQDNLSNRNKTAFSKYLLIKTQPSSPWLATEVKIKYKGKNKN